MITASGKRQVARGELGLLIDGLQNGCRVAEEPVAPVREVRRGQGFVIPPASISVISARYSPPTRSAGSPTANPADLVTTPAASRITGRADRSRTSAAPPIHAPRASTATWPSETIPTRPTSTPSPSATIEYTPTDVMMSTQSRLITARQRGPDEQHEGNGDGSLGR